MRVRIGTRGSELALTQARGIAGRLEAVLPDLEIEEIILRTRGDQDRETPLDQHGGVGLFTKELERALLAGEIDLAVHSLKDLPTQSPEGLVVAAIPEREEPWDVWISERYPDLIDLPAGAVVATGSLRRRAQIRHRFPHVEVVGIRGNIDTRLRKYPELGADGLILAAAGLVRTGREDVIRARLGPTEMTPAPGQGALGLQTRADDEATRACVAVLDDPGTRAAVTAERIFMATVEAGCHSPLGALGRRTEEALTLLGLLADPDGERQVQMTVEGAPDDPEGVGRALAAHVLKAGGTEILAAIRRETAE